MQVQSSFHAPNDGCAGHGFDDDDDDDNFPILLKMIRQAHQAFNHKSLILNKVFCTYSMHGLLWKSVLLFQVTTSDSDSVPDILGHYGFRL